LPRDDPSNLHEVERCPHCEEVLRLRKRVLDHIAKIVNTWFRKERGTAR
jgi:hypothetical protein